MSSRSARMPEHRFTNPISVHPRIQDFATSPVRPKTLKDEKSTTACRLTFTRHPVQCGRASFLNHTSQSLSKLEPDSIKQAATAVSAWGRHRRQDRTVYGQRRAISQVDQAPPKIVFIYQVRKRPQHLH